MLDNDTILKIDELITALENATKLQPRLVNISEAARYINRSESFLRNGKRHGTGPKYLQESEDSNIRYDIRDLDRWIDEQPRKGGAILR